MNITNIYDAYPVPKILQKHQIRAAALGAYLAENVTRPKDIDRSLIIKSLLLHDMGNIIKFDLDRDDFFTDEEKKHRGYWKEQQQIYKNKYSNDEHLATYAIVKELQDTDDVYNILSHTGSSKLQEVLISPDMHLRIVTYADLRCAPFGIVSIDERFDDVIKRYKGKDHPLSHSDDVEQRRTRALELERQLQQEIAIPLKKTTDETIADYMKLVLQKKI